MYYDPSFETVKFENKLNCQYYLYDVKTGTIENITSQHTTHSAFQTDARKQTEKAKKYEVCDQIYVYVGESDKTGKIAEVNVETAPYYEGDEVKMATSTNPFGWMK